MLNPLHVMSIVWGQNFASAKLPPLQRTPEKFGENAVMDDEQSVDQYNEALKSKLSIVYAAVLEIIHRSRRKKAGGRAIDLCCGPGHFTLMLAKYFDFDEVVGVDQSERMIEQAQQNARDWGLSDRVRFEVGDAMQNAALDGAFDVVACNDAAHHMQDLDTVSALISEMDRLSGDCGFAVLSDLIRLKDQSLTEQYLHLIGKDYLDRKLNRFFQDFTDSLHAAWTTDELASAIPARLKKRSLHIIQKLLPGLQLVAIFPHNGQPLRIRSGNPWKRNSHPVPKSLRTDWSLFRVTIRY